MRILYFFIDGIGFGKENFQINPFTRFAKNYLSPLGFENAKTPLNWRYKPIDAHLGMEGLPQSATGQTSLWTGINGSHIMGHHKTGFPGPTLIKILNEHSIVKRFCEQGLKASLINAYSDHYLKRIQTQPRFKSCSTHLQLASGQKLKTLQDLENNDAIYMDITHEIMHRLVPDLKSRFPIISPEKKGADIVKILKNYQLIIYEFFLSDKAGHKFDWEMAFWVIKTLESFIHGICQNMSYSEDLLIITSDHGNMEDMSTRSHTHNQVPLFLYGAKSDQVMECVDSISDIPETIYKLFNINSGIYAC